MDSERPSPLPSRLERDEGDIEGQMRDGQFKLLPRGGSKQWLYPSRSVCRIYRYVYNRVAVAIDRMTVRLEVDNGQSVMKINV